MDACGVHSDTRADFEGLFFGSHRRRREIFLGIPRVAERARSILVWLGMDGDALFRPLCPSRIDSGGVVCTRTQNFGHQTRTVRY